MIGGISLETEEVKRIILNFALEVQKQIPSNFQRKKKRVIVIPAHLLWQVQAGDGACSSHGWGNYFSRFHASLPRYGHWNC